MKTSLEMVREFHEAFGHPVSDTPIWDRKDDVNDLVELRLNLLQEELDELDDALYNYSEAADTKKLNAEVLDALCDLQVPR